MIGSRFSYLFISGNETAVQRETSCIAGTFSCDHEPSRIMIVLSIYLSASPLAVVIVVLLCFVLFTILLSWLSLLWLLSTPSSLLSSLCLLKSLFET